MNERCDQPGHQTPGLPDSLPAFEPKEVPVRTPEQPHKTPQREPVEVPA